MVDRARRRAPAALMAAIAILAAMVACGPDGSDAGGIDGRERLAVFAAASLTRPFNLIAREFELANPATTVELAFAGSSQLLSQIGQGAPADVFVSADETLMQQAIRSSLVVGQPVIVTRNRLAIVVHRGNPQEIRRLADLADDRLLVALCAEAVPAGRYARQALASAMVEVRPVSLEPSVTAVVTKVALGEVDAGIVYQTDVYPDAGDVEGVPIPAEHNVVATYPAARTTDARNPARADDFLAFTRTREAQGILADAGFLPP